MNEISRQIWKELPVNIEAEKCLIGALFANNRVYEKVADFLRPEHFAGPENVLIYTECANMIASGRRADPITLKQLFERDDRLQEIGGTAYLSDLASSVVSIMNAPEYGRVILDAYRKRELMEIGENAALAAGTGQETDEIIEGIEAGLARITMNLVKIDSSVSQMTRTMEGIQSAMNGEEPPGVSTGLLDLDRKLGRIRNQDLVIIAGRPSMGKTVLGINIAEAVSKEAPVLFFSLEMSAEQLNQRRLANKSGVDITRLRNGDIGTPEMDRMVPLSHELQSKPFIIDDRAALRMGDIRRRCQRQKDLGLVVVDYLGLMRPEDHRMNKVHQIEQITNGMKAMAKDLDIPVIVLSQLSREVEKRDNKRPTLADLRDSGSIEQDADTVIFLYREEYYLQRNEPSQKDGEKNDKFSARCDGYLNRLKASEGLAEIIVEKQRQGATGPVKTSFSGPLMRFGNLHREELV